MVTIVVVINMLIALMLFYVVWRIRQLQRLLAQIADNLSAYDRAIHTALSGAPQAISTGRLGIHKLRQGPQPLDLQLIRIQQVLTLFGIGQQVWQRTRLARRSKFLQKALAKYRYR
jgi:hypothetical protein